jgi:hypothetical protein
VTTPFDKAPVSIPVTVVTRAHGVLERSEGAAVIRMEPSPHDHAPGSECVACAARGDVRVLLFDLLQRSRQPGENPLISVIVDASDLADATPVIERLQAGGAPALGLRDMTVLRSFHLARVL